MGLRKNGGSKRGTEVHTHGNGAQGAHTFVRERARSGNHEYLPPADARMTNIITAAVTRTPTTMASALW